MLKISWQSLVACKASTEKSTDKFRLLCMWELISPCFQNSLTINYLMMMIMMLSVCPCRFLLFDVIWNFWVWNSIYSLKIRKFNAIFLQIHSFSSSWLPYPISVTLIISLLYLIVYHKAPKLPCVFFSLFKVHYLQWPTYKFTCHFVCLM